ncbi:MAG: S-layer homology domain-containing protein, partial [Candidatus Woesearchaeota archaeon]|nr:S-layer homology domain-containing protein [Candidatus Woesearchaeota archaeon]
YKYSVGCGKGGCEFEHAVLKANVNRPCIDETDASRKFTLAGRSEFCGNIKLEVPWSASEILIDNTQPYANYSFTKIIDIPNNYLNAPFQVIVHGNRNALKDGKDEDVYDCDKTLTVNPDYKNFFYCPDKDDSSIGGDGRFDYYNYNTKASWYDFGGSSYPVWEADGKGNDCISDLSIVDCSPHPTDCVFKTDKMPASTCEGDVFGDVNSNMVGGADFCRYVEKFADLGITAGCGNGNYCPNDATTRAQAAILILKARGQSPAGTCTGNAFTDVNTASVGDLTCRYIEKFKSLGIAAGYADGSFGPNNPMTRGQAAVLILKAIGQAPENVCTGAIFSDVNSGMTGGELFCRYVEKLANMGITVGYGNGNYGPNDATTRAQAAVLIMKAIIGDISKPKNSVLDADKDGEVEICISKDGIQGGWTDGDIDEAVCELIPSADWYDCNPETECSAGEDDYPDDGKGLCCGDDQSEKNIQTIVKEGGVVTQFEYSACCDASEGFVCATEFGGCLKLGDSICMPGVPAKQTCKQSGSTYYMDIISDLSCQNSCQRCDINEDGEVTDIDTTAISNFLDDGLPYDQNYDTNNDESNNGDDISYCNAILFSNCESCEDKVNNGDDACAVVDGDVIFGNSDEFNCVGEKKHNVEKRNPDYCGLACNYKYDAQSCNSDICGGCDSNSDCGSMEYCNVNSCSCEPLLCKDELCTEMDCLLCSSKQCVDTCTDAKEAKEYLHNLNATIYGAKSTTSGKIGGAMEFDGVDDYLHVPASYNLSNFSIAVWVKPNDDSTATYGDAIFEKEFALKGTQLTWHSSGKFMFMVSNGTKPNQISGQAGKAKNQWYLVIGTYNGTHAKLYVNGVKEGELETLSVPNNTLAINMGAWETRPAGTMSRPFKGVIDEVKVYERALTTQEILQLFGNMPVRNGMIMYYPFDEVSSCTNTCSQGDCATCPYVCVATEEIEVTVDNKDNDCDGLIDEPYFNKGGVYVWESSCNYYACVYKDTKSNVKITGDLTSYTGIMLEGKDDFSFANKILDFKSYENVSDILDCVRVRSSSVMTFDVNYSGSKSKDNVYLGYYGKHPINNPFKYASPTCSQNCNSPNECGDNVFNLKFNCGYDECIFDCGGYWVDEAGPGLNNDYCSACTESTECSTYTNEYSCYYDPCKGAGSAFGCRWENDECVDAFEQCAPGTTLCKDGSCSPNCKDKGKAECVLSYVDYAQIKDMAGNNNGKVVNAKLISKGKYGEGFDFNNARIETPDSSDIDMDDEFTVVTWIKADTCSETEAGIYEKGDFGLYIYEDDNKCYLRTEVDGDDIADIRIGDEKWIHTALVVSGDHAKFYINGTLKGDESIGSLDNAGTLFIGSDHSNNYYDGKMDEFMIYDEALDATQINKIYVNSEVSGKALWYTFNADGFKSVILGPVGPANGICEMGEGCACEDCEGKQDSCTDGAICDSEEICGCPVGTTLCEDMTCSSDCDDKQGCNGAPNGNCQLYEGCACIDCRFKQDSCVEGAICANDLCTKPGVIICKIGESLCADLTCDKTCDGHGGKQGCVVENGVCDKYEGCACADCNGKQDSCSDSAVCDYSTKLCKSKAPGGEVPEEPEEGSGYCTQTQGGWGAACNGGNVGCLRDSNWAKAVGSNLVVGEGFKMTFSNSKAVEDYLPAGKTAGALTKDHTNPIETESGILGGQVTALKLNVLYSEQGVGLKTTGKIGNLYIVSGKYAGMSVNEFLEHAEKVLGGYEQDSFADINSAATSINENFDNCNIDKGYLLFTKPSSDKLDCDMSLEVTDTLETLERFDITATIKNNKDEDFSDVVVTLKAPDKMTLKESQKRISLAGMATETVVFEGLVNDYSYETAEFTLDVELLGKDKLSKDFEMEVEIPRFTIKAKPKFEYTPRNGEVCLDFYYVLNDEHQEPRDIEMEILDPNAILSKTVLIDFVSYVDSNSNILVKPMTSNPYCLPKADYEIKGYLYDASTGFVSMSAESSERIDLR